MLIIHFINDTDIFDIKSSYAGAIGIPQFMPSNVLTYAVSGTGNKHIDIINNHLDALYSVANFLNVFVLLKALFYVL